MMGEASYKLGRYKIIEGPGNVICWESHSGLGSTQTGRCFVEGNILVIGPAEAEQPGFLKREFMEHLNQLPTWEKTKYYCSSQSIYISKTQQRLSFTAEVNKHVDLSLDTGEGRIVTSERDQGRIVSEPVPGMKMGAFLKGKVMDIWTLLKRLPRGLSR